MQPATPISNKTSNVSNSEQLAVAAGGNLLSDAGVVG
jgi:hypothetical protein